MTLTFNSLADSNNSEIIPSAGQTQILIQSCQDNLVRRKKNGKITNQDTVVIS